MLDQPIRVATADIMTDDQEDTAQETLSAKALHRGWVRMDAPRVLHSLPGRLRAHLPGWTGDDADTLERKLAQTPGVQRVRANAVTGNVLICFDPVVTDEQSLLARLRLLLMVRAVAPTDAPQVQDVLARPAANPAREGARRGMASAPARVGRMSRRRQNHQTAALLLKGAGILAGLVLADTPLAPVLAAIELAQLVVRSTAQPPAGA